MRAPGNLTEFHLKADGNTSITLVGLGVHLFLLLHLFPQIITVTHAAPVSDISACPGECSPVRDIHFPCYPFENGMQEYNMAPSHLQGRNGTP